MVRRSALVLSTGLSVVLGTLLTAPSTTHGAATAESRLVGRVTSANAEQGRLTVETDQGEAVTVGIDGSTRCMRVPPGEKSLANAVPIGIADINLGDRVLARVPASASGSPAAASLVLVIPRADLEQKRQQELADWKARGTVGRIASLDASATEVTLVAQSLRETKTTIVAVQSETGIRRYAPGSIRFQEARPSSFEELKMGDQLWVLGESQENSEGARIEAEQLVAGAFRNFAATVRGVEAGEGTVRVKDLETGKTFAVHIVEESVLRRLPERMAFFLGMALQRSKAGEGEGGPPRNFRRGGSGRGGRPPGGGFGGAGGGSRPGAMGGRRPNMNFQEVLQRAPEFSIDELKPGEPLIVSSTTGEGDTPIKAITVVAGVEPLLAAGPGALGPLGGSWSMSINVPQ